MNNAAQVLSHKEKLQLIDKETARADAAERAQKHLQHQLDILTQENESLQATLANQDKLSNLHGWAVDRAISMLKGDGNVIQFEAVEKLSRQLAYFAYGKDYEEIKESIQ